MLNTSNIPASFWSKYLQKNKATIFLNLQSYIVTLFFLQAVKKIWRGENAILKLTSYDFIKAMVSYFTDAYPSD